MRAGFKRGFTPLHLRLMLHYYAQPHLPYGTPAEANAPATLEYQRELCEAFLIESYGDGRFYTTHKGNVFVDKLLSTAHILALP